MREEDWGDVFKEEIPGANWHLETFRLINLFICLWSKLEGLAGEAEERGVAAGPLQGGYLYGLSVGGVGHWGGQEEGREEGWEEGGCPPQHRPAHFPVTAALDTGELGPSGVLPGLVLGSPQTSLRRDEGAGRREVEPILGEAHLSAFSQPWCPSRPAMWSPHSCGFFRPPWPESMDFLSPLVGGTTLFWI